MTRILDHLDMWEWAVVAILVDGLCDPDPYVGEIVVGALGIARDDENASDRSRLLAEVLLDALARIDPDDDEPGATAALEAALTAAGREKWIAATAELGIKRLSKMLAGGGATERTTKET